MTVAFFKLHVAGNDFILVDRERPGHEELFARPDALEALAGALVDRQRGVGARAAIFAGGGQRERGTVALRVFYSDGAERYGGGDAFLCAARWALDSGRAGGGRVVFSTPSGERVLRALDSRSFSTELDPPGTFLGDRPGALRPEDGREARVELVLDGQAAAAYLIEQGSRYAVALGRRQGIRASRLKAALLAAAPGAVPVVARTVGRDQVAFAAGALVDRLGAAAAAACAARLAGRVDEEVVAEWRGKGAAAAFADFGGHRTEPQTGPGVLIDRGRFYIDWKRPERILAAGMAEYAFDGNFDYY